MKTIIYIGIIGVLLISIFSCENKISDFLDKAPGVDVTEDTIFSTKAQIETFVAGTYRYGLHTGYAYNDGTYSGTVYDTWTTASDEGEVGDTWYRTQKYNSGGMTASGSGMDDRYSIRWIAIRRTNIILERIGSVPNLDLDYAKQVEGEAKFIRALNYFEMFKHYGGVPIIEKRFQNDDNFIVKRNTVEELVNFIVKDCDDAASLLPSVYISNLRGRATKGAALMLKAKTLLYAASPLFNTAEPYMDLGENNKLICYGNFDNNRWQKAADAAKTVIDWAPTAGCALITDQGVEKNYKYAWEKLDNQEIILAEKSRGATPYYTWPWLGICARSMYSGWGGVSVTLNFVKFYEKRDGTPQAWDPNGGNDLNQKYAELDPRFKQTIAYNGSYWNIDYPIVQTYTGGVDAPNCKGGHWLHKWVPDALTKSSPAIPNWTLFRLAEAYLSYAEALNEVKGPVADAYDAVNIIRRRSGMPDLPAGLTKEQFREKIKNERTVELAFEDHRFWDVKRWMIAENEGIMKGNMWGLKITKITAGPANANTVYRYDPYIFEIRVFPKYYYLHAFRTVEVNKGGLIQNPGW